MYIFYAGRLQASIKFAQMLIFHAGAFDGQSPRPRPGKRDAVGEPGAACAVKQ